MEQPKLILINGFAGAGKTTIARKYVDEHPLALVIEGDELIVNMGQWLKHEQRARELVFELTKNMVRTQLHAGHDVVLPYLVANAQHVDEFEALAAELGAIFYEIVLHSEKTEAIARLLKRGTWGEAGLPPLTDKDLPEIEKLINKMEAELEKRPNSKVIALGGNTPDVTYRQLIGYVGGQ